MKINRSYPRRRKAVAGTLLDVTIVEGKIETWREPQRKALLIGINYGGQVAGQRGMQLMGPHRDVQAMKKLLMETYEYKNESITILMDAEGYEQPTRENILREIDNLIKDAQARDTFFFHYCGHGGQIKNRTNSEEDGLDECIIPSDARDSYDRQWIIDNELKHRLVDPLPVGSNLIAVFDSCHSESLLDLYHSHCNRVWVPWISKGKRRSQSLMSKQVKRLAMDDTTAVVASRRVWQSKRISSRQVLSRRTSIDKVRPMEGIAARLKRLSINVKSLELKSEFVPSSEAPPQQQSQQPHWWPSNMSPILRCDSPIGQFCTGDCREQKGDAQDEAMLANVISIGACTDGQSTWEAEDGDSMTSALIEILGQDPNPSYQKLMVLLSHKLHDLSMKVHSSSKQWKTDVKTWRAKQEAKGRVFSRSASDGMTLETQNFQDPQLSSHKPLDMNDTFRLAH
ncbi:peptidase C14 [Pleurotus eryngii]|uniref:Peptidase C14 n=1 Tax=Pleurotus eryngii TaxID=5323 RepID=A0A9P5ZXW1_PLEER|nr:peptidase C14 [Pleurotus eryngii]